mmetsp:Transcript_16778/g.48183  ORF Transcript_16778/g.48183 Transcript_16778/m.48183 type:complete len:226 (-) Transcript_16778:1237-1914(-)
MQWPLSKTRTMLWQCAMPRRRPMRRCRSSMKPLKSIRMTTAVMKAQTKMKILVMARRRRVQKRSRARKRSLPLQLPKRIRRPPRQNQTLQPPKRRTSPQCPRQKRIWRKNLPSGRTELEVIWQRSMHRLDRRSAMGFVSEKKLIHFILLISTPTNSACTRLQLVAPSRRSGTSKKLSRPRKAKNDERWKKVIFSLRCHRPRFSRDSVIFMSGKRRGYELIRSVAS